MGRDTKKIVKNDRGDAVIVSAVLIMSILLSLSGRLIISYGDVVGKEMDMEHACDLEDSFVRIRMSMRALLEAEDTNTVIVNRVTLGTFGNPYLAVARSSGILHLDPRPQDFSLSIILRDNLAGGQRVINTYTGSLEYRSNNYYFHDQNYLLQAGAVILEEYGSYSVSSPPSLIFEERISGTYSLRMNGFGLSGEEWSIAGFESITTVTRMLSSSSFQIAPSSNEDVIIRVTGPTRFAWADHLSSRFLEMGFGGGDFNIVDGGSYADFEILDIDEFNGNFGEMEVSI